VEPRIVNARFIPTTASFLVPLSALIGFGYASRVPSVHVLVASSFFFFNSCHSMLRVASSESSFSLSLSPIRIAYLYHHLTILDRCPLEIHLLPAQQNRAFDMCPFSVYPLSLRLSSSPCFDIPVLYDPKLFPVPSLCKYVEWIEMVNWAPLIILYHPNR